MTTNVSNHNFCAKVPSNGSVMPKKDLCKTVLPPESTTKSRIPNALEAMALLAKSNLFVKKDLEKEYKHLERQFKKIESDVSYKSVDQFKSSGGYFDETGRAMIKDAKSGEEKPFNGVIRTEYSKSDRPLYQDTREYAVFDDNGYLSMYAKNDGRIIQIDEITAPDGTTVFINSTKSTYFIGDASVNKGVLDMYGLG